MVPIKRSIVFGSSDNTMFLVQSVLTGVEIFNVFRQTFLHLLLRRGVE